jgi:hypothetical protein
VQKARDEFSASAQAERDRLKEEADSKALESKAAMERTTVKPEDLRNTLTSLGKAKSVKEAAQIAATAGVDAATLDKLSDKYSSIFGDDEVGAVAAFSQAVREAAAARGGVATTTTTGQSGGSVVQSGTVRMIKDGKSYNIPADRVEAAKAKGYTLQ